MQNKIQGALWGLLIGDAVGVPYEFNKANVLPAYTELDLVCPTNFNKTYAHIPCGTWSDDGAQALCLLASLLECHRVDLTDFATRLLHWLKQGYMAVDAQVFDVGIQTQKALFNFQQGIVPEKMAQNIASTNGNGSLMRCLPLALWHKGTDQALIEDAFAQSLVTHAHIRAKLCCALYCLWARYLIQNEALELAWQHAIRTLTEYIATQPEALNELNEYILNYAQHFVPGRGYVVDCLYSAKLALQQNSFKDVIKTAISFGDDTDTTACVAGGLAGIIYGFDAIPESWKKQLRGQDIVMPLYQDLLQHLN